MAIVDNNYYDEVAATVLTCSQRSPCLDYSRFWRANFSTAKLHSAYRAKNMNAYHHQSNTYKYKGKRKISLSKQNNTHWSHAEIPGPRLTSFFIRCQNTKLIRSFPLEWVNVNEMLTRKGKVLKQKTPTFCNKSRCYCWWNDE